MRARTGNPINWAYLRQPRSCEACVSQHGYIPRLDFVSRLEHEHVTKNGYAGFEGCRECLAGLHDCHDSSQPADLSLIREVLGNDWI